MNLDRLIPKSIRNDSTPVETMLETLESFADASGGPLWRQNRARKTELMRTLTLYIDEDYEMCNPEVRKPLREHDGEEIEISFTAERIPMDDDEDDLNGFSNLYTISHSVSLPLADIFSMPQQYQEELLQELAIEDDEIEGAEMQILRNENNPGTGTGDNTSILETNVIKYTISEEDGTIEYEQYIDYTCGDILIKGAEYTSDIDATSVHGNGMDEHSEEWLSAEVGVDDDRVEALGERIFLLDAIEEISTDERHRMELLSQSNEQHAVRILALLSLIGANIRRRKSREDLE